MDELSEGEKKKIQQEIQRIEKSMNLTGKLQELDEMDHEKTQSIIRRMKKQDEVIKEMGKISNKMIKVLKKATHQMKTESNDTFLNYFITKLHTKNLNLKEEANDKKRKIGFLEGEIVKEKAELDSVREQKKIIMDELFRLEL